MTIGSALLYLILLFIQTESFLARVNIITSLLSFLLIFFLTVHNFSKFHWSVFHDLHFYDRQKLALPLTWLHSLHKYVYLCRTLCFLIDVSCSILMFCCYSILTVFDLSSAEVWAILDAALPFYSTLETTQLRYLKGQLYVQRNFKGPLLYIFF